MEIIMQISKVFMETTVIEWNALMCIDYIV